MTSALLLVGGWSVALLVLAGSWSGGRGCWCDGSSTTGRTTIGWAGVMGVRLGWAGLMGVRLGMLMVITGGLYTDSFSPTTPAANKDSDAQITVRPVD